MPINRRKSRVQPKPAKKSYTKKAVDDAYREVQGKMRKEVTKMQKYEMPVLTKLTGFYDNPRSIAKLDHAINASQKKMEDIGMKARAKRTKAVSAAAKKHGVPKSQILARKPINPGEYARKKATLYRGMFTARHHR